MKYLIRFLLVICVCKPVVADERDDVLTALRSSGRYFQVSANKCGPYSAFLACRYKGKEIVFSDVDTLIPKDEQGYASLLSVKRFLEGRGITVSAQKLAKTSELPSGKGIILVLKRADSPDEEQKDVRHFVFALANEEGSLLIYDPVLKVGKSVLSRDALGEIWTGECLILL